MSENSQITGVSQAANSADISAVWATKPESTVKAFTTLHTVKDGDEVVYPAGYQIFGSGKDKDEVKEVIRAEGRNAAEGEKAQVFRGSVDIGAIWDLPVEVLRGYAAAGILLNAQQLFKARVLAGTAVVGSQADMDQAFSDMCATPAAMQGITPTATKTAGEGRKSGGGKVAKLEAELAAAKAKDEQRAVIMEKIRNSKGADKLAAFAELDALEG